MDTENLSKRPELEQSEIIDRLPRACSDEAAAVEFIESMRWGDMPSCVHCGSVNVYKMTDGNGGRNKRFLWRCHDCKQQYTVRIGAVYEETRLPLRYWCYCFWRISTSKKGVAAMEVMRQCQISYKSALFLLHRVRWALRPDPKTAPKLTGIVEADETFVGGKPRKPVPRQKWSNKTPVAGVVERREGGQIRRRVVADVTGKNIKQAIREVVDLGATIHSDESGAYTGIGIDFKGGHFTVNHSQLEYARDGVHVNTMESSHAIIKRAIIGIYHAVSKKHLHRYISECDFRWNYRTTNDGERVKAAIRAADGKRLMYREPVRPDQSKATQYLL